MDKKAELQYYRNLLNAVDIKTYADMDLDTDSLSNDQVAGLEYVVCRLSENEQEILRLRYEERMSYVAIGEKKGISAARAGQIHSGAVWKLRQPSFYVWYVEGFHIHDEKRKAGADWIRQSLQKQKNVGILEKNCMKLNIPYGLYERLRQAGLGTIGNLQNVMKKRVWHESVRGVRVKQAGLLVCRMMEMELIDENYAAVKEYYRRKNADT